MTAKQATLDDQTIVDVPLTDRMEQAFLDYSMSVIVGRALPDARDGLKPVQRRILYSMWESGLRPERPYRKCASAVGEVMKKYHPHGDTSIYDALVRMAQDFSTREPLVDGHGNFGSIDGDPPAAMRYTEARLSPLAMELLAGINEDTVDFVPNYDGYEQEPTVLPARFPNLLVNGSSGIAVGMATNIAPHNLGEAIDATILLINKPRTSLDKLMEVMPAPDFPTGARIVQSDGIRDAFANGRGAVTIEAVATTEVRSGNLPRIVITEIPYQVNKASLLERIAALVQDKKLPEIRDLRDESSRDGMRIVIELKRGQEPAGVLSALFKQTDLRTNFNVNNVALVDGAPQTLGLIDLLKVYIEHQRDVLTRRTKYRLKRAEERAHILEGLLLALDNLDAVIKLIRGSESAAKAKEGLVKKFKMSEVQAQAVLDMQLRRLAALERAELEDEYQELKALMKELRAILKDRKQLDAVLIEELKAIKKTHATPRRSEIVAEGIPEAELVDGVGEGGGAFEGQEITLTVSAGGYLKSMQRRRTTSAHKHAKDPLVSVLRGSTDDRLLVIDENGGGYRLDAADIPIVPPRQRGTQIASMIGGVVDAPIAGAVPLLEGWAVTTVTANGQVKRTDVAEFADSRQRTVQAAGLKDGDAVVAVLLTRDDDELITATDAGKVARFALADVRLMGRTAAGVAGMNTDGGRIVSATRVPANADENAVILTLGANGEAKQAPLADYPAKGRGGKGVQAGPDPLAWCGLATDLHAVADGAPVVIRHTDAVVSKRTGKGATVAEGPIISPVAGELDFSSA